MGRTRTSSRVDPIQAAIDGIPTEALECRRKRQHDWDGYTVDNGDVRGEKFVTERCRRCDSKRMAWWRDDGEEWTQLTPWRPDLIPGYLVAGGLPDAARRRLWGEHFRRQRA